MLLNKIWKHISWVALIQNKINNNKIIEFILLGAFYVLIRLLLYLDEKDSSDIVIFSILIILFFILTGFKNIYRIITIKIYSPMTRALIECILDPILYSMNTYGKEEIWYYIINIICLIIMGFCIMGFWYYISVV